MRVKQLANFKRILIIGSTIKFFMVSKFNTHHSCITVTPPKIVLAVNARFNLSQQRYFDC